MKLLQNVRKTYYFLKRNGLRQTYYAVRERLTKRRSSYYYEAPDVAELKRQRTEFAGCDASKYPLLSVVVPLFETREVFLRELLASVLSQTYPFFEVILGDFSSDNQLKQVVEDYADARLKYHYFGDNKGIAENTNRAIDLVSGSYVGLLDHDDVLTEDALYEVYQGITEERRAGYQPLLLFSDEDKWTGEKGQYYSLHRKEEYNRELLFSGNYICHFMVMDTELIQKLRFRSKYSGAQDYDLVLRAVAKIEQMDKGSIRHIPKVLYHWRCHEGSSAENPVSKTYAYEAGKKALEDYFTKQGIQAKVSHRLYVGLYQIDYETDYFEARPEVGILGFALVERGVLVSGRLNLEGEVYYEGTKEGYTGYFHRAILPQDAEAVDVRRMKLNPACREVFKKITGCDYEEDEQGFCSNFRTLSQPEAVRLSLLLCQAVRQAGYHIIWQW